MEGRRQPVEGDDDLDVEWGDLDDSGRGCLSYPDFERPVQDKPSFCVQHLRLPEADGRQTELGPRRQSVERAPLAVRKPIGAEQPPQPNVRVQQDFHRDARNSASSITDVSGSAFSSPEPRRTSHAFGAAAPGFGAGVSRATTLPRRLMSTTSPPPSARRISSRQRARNCVTEMSMWNFYMAIFGRARGGSVEWPNKRFEPSGVSVGALRRRRCAGGSRATRSDEI